MLIIALIALAIIIYVNRESLKETFDDVFNNNEPVAPPAPPAEEVPPVEEAPVEEAKVDEVK